MILVIDIGNTNVVLGVYKDNKLVSCLRLHTKKDLPSNEWASVLIPEFEKLQIDLLQISKVVIASVVPELNNKIDVFFQKLIPQTKPIWVTYKTPLGIDIDVDMPEQVGADRIVSAAAAFHKYKTNLIVVDMGTATSFDCVVNGTFIGGVIAPGLATSAAHLFKNASQLEKIEIKKPKKVIGKNTKHCLESGLFYGYLGLIESTIEKIEKETNKKMLIIMTGGLAPLFVDELKPKALHEPHLTLEGLKRLADS